MHVTARLCGTSAMRTYALQTRTVLCAITMVPLPSARQHPSYGDFWRLRGNIIGTALCWIVWHNVHSQQHTYVSSSYRSNRLGLSHWDPYAVCRGGCLELYYCNMVEWFWWDSSLISTTNWFPSVLWHCWFGHLGCKNRPRNDLLCVEWDVKRYTLTHYHNGPLMCLLLSLLSTVAVMAWVHNTRLAGRMRPARPRGNWVNFGTQLFLTGLWQTGLTIFFQHSRPN